MNAYDVNLAVLAGHGNKKERVFDLSYGIFHGTAFCLAPNLFLTAAHVFEDAQGDGEVALARLKPNKFHVQLVKDFELFKDIDLAIMYCPNLSAEILPFDFSPLNFLVDVFAMGFPFGFEPPTYYLRGFKGHIVTRRTLTSLTGVPAGYELSLIPPPGLSGAALLSNKLDGSTMINGMILRHHIAEYRGYQMVLGIALDIEEILFLESRIVNGSIAERLFNRNRLIRN